VRELQKSTAESPARRESGEAFGASEQDPDRERAALWERLMGAGERSPPTRLKARSVYLGLIAYA